MRNAREQQQSCAKPRMRSDQLHGNSNEDSCTLAKRTRAKSRLRRITRFKCNLPLETRGEKEAGDVAKGQKVPVVTAIRFPVLFSLFEHMARTRVVGFKKPNDGNTCEHHPPSPPREASPREFYARRKRPQRRGRATRLRPGMLSREFCA